MSIRKSIKGIFDKAMYQEEYDDERIIPDPEDAAEDGFLDDVLDEDFDDD